jgi:hypothetical protein
VQNTRKHFFVVGGIGDVLEHRGTIHKLCFDNRCNTLCRILQEMLGR